MATFSWDESSNKEYEVLWDHLFDPPQKSDPVSTRLALAICNATDIHRTAGTRIFLFP